MNCDNPTLIYDMPGSGWLRLKIKNKIISKIKSNQLARKIAMKGYRIYKKYGA
jgi:hypothetical protein